eukprot:91628-Ditylum_brightwellii.AAC.1
MCAYAAAVRTMPKWQSLPPPSVDQMDWALAFNLFQSDRSAAIIGSPWILVRSAVSKTVFL